MYEALQYEKKNRSNTYMIDSSYANIERKKRTGARTTRYMTFFFRTHLYTQLLEERTNICIIQLLTIVEVTTNRPSRTHFFLLRLYNQHEENSISIHRLFSYLT